MGLKDETEKKSHDIAMVYHIPLMMLIDSLGIVEIVIMIRDGFVCK